jgi:hypothetical protein
MFRRTSRLLVLAAALAALVSGAAGNARADTGPVAPVGPALDFCASATANATLNLGAGVPSVEASSAGGSYAAGLCARFVTDITVPTSSGAPNYWSEFSVYGAYADLQTGSSLGGLPLSQIECANYSGYLRVYRKSVLGGSFTVLGGGTTHGSWVADGGMFGPYCALVKAPGYVDLPAFNPPSLFGVIYRVAFGAKVGSSWRQVRDGAAHPAIIY